MSRLPQPAHEEFCAVVVDDTQDFAPLWWEALRACMKDSESAEIYTFLDDGQDVYKRWAGDDAISDLIPIHIDDNLRNTKRIVETFKGFAGDKFMPRGSTGMAVRMVEDCVEALIGDGWAYNQIALLTTKTRHPIHVEYSDRNAIGEYWRDFHANEREFYGRILGFKGLERSVIVLCVNGFKDMERASELLYAGLSRARTLLVVVGDPEQLREAGGNQLATALGRAQKWSP